MLIINLIHKLPLTIAPLSFQKKATEVKTHSVLFLNSMQKQEL